MIEQVYDNKNFVYALLTWISDNSLCSAFDLGPGTAVFTVGPFGSPGTNELAHPKNLNKNYIIL